MQDRTWLAVLIAVVVGYWLGRRTCHNDGQAARGFRGGAGAGAGDILSAPLPAQTSGGAQCCNDHVNPSGSSAWMP